MVRFRTAWCACFVLALTACPAEETSNNTAVDAGANNTTGNPAECPRTPPATEAACSTEGLSCTYALGCPCGPDEDFVWTCTGGVLVQPSLLCSTGAASSCPEPPDLGPTDMAGGDVGATPDMGADMSAPDMAPTRLEAHGCAYADAMDQTGNAALVLTDLVPWDFTHTNVCIRVSRNTVVTWNGNFDTHPLNGGVAPTEDPNSPIDLAAQDAAGDDTVDATLVGRGDYPYYCVAHAGIMRGVIYVD